MRCTTAAVLVLSATFFNGFYAGADDKPFTQVKDKIYADVDGIGLLMDVFTPTGPKNGLAIVDIASGAWHSDRGKIRDHEAGQTYNILCTHGYVVFAVRPGSRTIYTALDMVSHVKTGIRYVKAHAEQYGFDPNRIGLMGASAGGHLAMMVTLTPEDGDPQAKDNLKKFDTRVVATCAFFPPADFNDWAGSQASATRLGDLIFRGGAAGKSPEEITEAYKKISPVSLIGKGVPPVLLFHGDKDQMVPLQQSQKLEKALKDAGNSVELHVKAGGEHPWPTIHEEIGIMADWFDKTINAVPAKQAAAAK
jgi:acetyl esterase/lipase